jgi:hypothetical protein
MPEQLRHELINAELLKENERLKEEIRLRWGMEPLTEIKTLDAHKQFLKPAPMTPVRLAAMRENIERHGYFLRHDLRDLMDGYENKIKSSAKRLTVVGNRQEHLEQIAQIIFDKLDAPLRTQPVMCKILEALDDLAN